MVFDIKKLKPNQKEKIARGALKYIAIKESFEPETPLYKNELFRKYFTDFYKLTRGAFSTPIMQEAFYRLFQSIRDLYDKKYNRYDLFKNITTIISAIAGDNEKSFSSKILHTLDNDSPIIDSNVLSGLRITSTTPYKDLRREYLYGSNIYKEYEKPIFDPSLSLSYCGGLIPIAIKDNWDVSFKELCLAEYGQILTSPSKKKGGITDIVKDIFRINCLKSSTSTIDRLEKEIVIEEFFNKEKWIDEEVDGKETAKDYITKKIKDISLVKKIDFYLWAYFAQSVDKGHD